jgi:hypothetical protein
MNESNLALFKRWLEIEERAATENFRTAEEGSLEEEYFNARGDAFSDAMIMLEKLCRNQ